MTREVKEDYQKVWILSQQEDEKMIKYKNGSENEDTQFFQNSILYDVLSNKNYSPKTKY